MEVAEAFLESRVDRLTVDRRRHRSSRLRHTPCDITCITGVISNTVILHMAVRILPFPVILRRRVKPEGWSSGCTSPEPTWRHWASWARCYQRSRR
eukprot:scaffold77314_cov57-Phaeocystis_antarctica.AAC.1